MNLSTRNAFLWLAALILVLLVILSIFPDVSGFFGLRSRETPMRTPPLAPALTAERTTSAIGSKGFSMLISYTDDGFEPVKVAVKQGDTVRFTNNATKTMRISAGSPSYPGKNAGCKGTSPLDSCADLPPGEYWEFTFDTTGAWNFNDTFGMSGAVMVK